MVIYDTLCALPHPFWVLDLEPPACPASPAGCRVVLSQRNPQCLHNFFCCLTQFPILHQNSGWFPLLFVFVVSFDRSSWRCNVPLQSYLRLWELLLCHTELLHSIKNSANRGDASPMKCYQRYCIGPSASQVHQLRQIRTPWKCLIIMRCGCFKNLFSVCSHSGSPYGRWSVCVTLCGPLWLVTEVLPQPIWIWMETLGTQISWQYIHPPLLPYFPTTSAFKRSSKSLKATHTITTTCLIFCSKYFLRMDKFVWRKQSKQTNTNDLSDLLLVLLVLLFEPAWLWDCISWGTK